MNSGLRKIIFDERNFILIANEQWDDILPLCKKLKNLTICVGCSPANPRFPDKSLRLREHDAERVTLQLLHAFCSQTTTARTEASWVQMTTVPENAVTSQAITVVRVWPLCGPLAGGTRLTITGQLQGVSTVTAVYFGQ